MESPVQGNRIWPHATEGRDATRALNTVADITVTDRAKDGTIGVAYGNGCIKLNNKDELKCQWTVIYCRYSHSLINIIKADFKKQSRQVLIFILLNYKQSRRYICRKGLRTHHDTSIEIVIRQRTISISKLVFILKIKKSTKTKFAPFQVGALYG